MRRLFPLLLGLPLAISVIIFALHSPESFVGLDIKVYDRVLYPASCVDTALQLLTDVEGKVVVGYYAPISSLSLMADSFLGEKGLANPKITNAVQVILHCLNGILVFVLLKLLNVKPLTALIASSIFLVHPLQVTAVMWFAERKTLLAMLFFLITYSTFVIYRRTSLRFYYGISLLSFLLGLLSKPVAVMFPLLALLGDLLGLHSRPSANQNSADTIVPEGDSQYSLLIRRLELILPALFPYVLAAIGVGVLAINTESTDSFSLPLLHRPFVAVSALWFYIEKILVPIELMYIYPLFTTDYFAVWSWLPVVLTTFTIFILFRHRKRIAPLVWWASACFVAMLLPTLGLVTFGTLEHTSVANYFCYLSLMGGGLVIALVVESLFASTKLMVRSLTAVVLVCYATLLVVQANAQAEIWSSPAKLWNDNIERCPTCWVPRQLLGVHLLEAGQTTSAAVLFRKAIELNPNNHLNYNHLGEAMLRTGNFSDAEKLFMRAIQLRQNDPAPYNNMGNLMRAKGEIAQALQFYSHAVKLSPSNATVQNNLGTGMLQSGNVTEAIIAFETAVSLKPRFAKAHANLGFSLLKVNRVGDAEAHLLMATELDPNLAAAQNALGRILMAKGAFSRAIHHFRMAVAAQPDLTEAKTNLEVALQRHGTKSND